MDVPLPLCRQQANVAGGRMQHAHTHSPAVRTHACSRSVLLMAGAVWCTQELTEGVEWSEDEEQAEWLPLGTDRGASRTGYVACSVVHSASRGGGGGGSPGFMCCAQAVSIHGQACIRSQGPRRHHLPLHLPLHREPAACMMDGWDPPPPSLHHIHLPLLACPCIHAGEEGAHAHARQRSSSEVGTTPGLCLQHLASCGQAAQPVRQHTLCCSIARPLLPPCWQHTHSAACAPTRPVRETWPWL